MKHCIYLVILLVSSASHQAFCQGKIYDEQLTTDIDYNIVLSKPHEHVPEQVIRAYHEKANAYLTVSLDSVILTYLELNAYCLEKDKNEALAESHFRVAEFYKMKGDLNNSIYHHNKALDNKDLPTQFIPSSQMSIGRAYITLDSLDQAVIYINKACDGYMSRKDTAYFSVVYQAKAHLAENLERPITAADYYIKALEWIQYNPAPDLNKCNILTSLAGIYSDQQNHEKAIGYFNEVVAIATEKDYKTKINQALFQLGSIYLSINEYGHAIDNLLVCLEFYEASSYTYQINQIYSKLALAYLGEGKFEAAKNYVDQAESLLPQIDVSQQKNDFYIARGYVHLQQRKFNEALSDFEFALDIAEQSQNTRRTMEAIEGIMELEASRNNFYQAYFMSKLYLEKYDSLYKLEQSKLIFDHEARYQKAEQDVQIINLNSENKLKDVLIEMKNRQLTWTIGGGFALLIFALGIAYAYRRIKNSEEALKEKNLIISKALKTNKVLLKEIHHRVKNNLQVVSSLLFLQSRFIKDDKALDAIKTGRARVQSMSLLHQKLYQTDNLQSVNIQAYFKDLAENLFHTYKIKEDRIEFVTDLEDLELDIDTVIPMGLITNELISNSLQHAFGLEASGMIKLSIIKEGDFIVLTVSDNGKGLPFDILPENSPSLGLELINSFAEKLNAEIMINNSKGTEIKLKFLPLQVSTFEER